MSEGYFLNGGVFPRKYFHLSISIENSLLQIYKPSGSLGIPNELGINYLTYLLPLCLCVYTYVCMHYKGCWKVSSHVI